MPANLPPNPSRLSEHPRRVRRYRAVALVLGVDHDTLAPVWVAIRGHAPHGYWELRYEDGTLPDAAFTERAAEARDYDKNDKTIEPHVPTHGKTRDLNQDLVDFEKFKAWAAKKGWVAASDTLIQGWWPAAKAYKERFGVEISTDALRRGFRAAGILASSVRRRVVISLAMLEAFHERNGAPPKPSRKPR